MTEHNNTMRTNSIEKQGKKPTDKSALSKRLRWVLIFLVIVVGTGAFVSLRRSSNSSDDANKNPGTFTVRRGDLTISVTENGDIKALNSINIKSKLERSTTLIWIVDEGTYITPEDVNNGKTLVELNSSETKQKVIGEEIAFLDCQADFAAAKEAVDIQKNQNESDTEAGRMKVRFGLMDLHKYLGASVAEELIAKAEHSQNWQDEISSFVYDPNLGGEALQRLRELNSSIKLTEARLARAEDKLEGTQELYDSNYVAEIELKGDQLEVQSLEIQKEQDETAKELYVKYEFPKQATMLLSDYHESKRELERIEARARSKLAQAQAEFDKEEAKYALSVDRLKHEREQLEACTIRAPAPGQVVYASSMERRGRRSSPTPIEPGVKIQEHQSIIFIPDASQMKVEIKIHETWVDKVQPGQQARITAAAFLDKTFTGKVLKKAPLADPESWLNPDLKVYSTDVSIDGTHEFLKTGMSAKVEIIIHELRDVLSVPIQAVITWEGAKVCFVMTSNGPERREVETGLFNDNFVEIKSGLVQGEKVMLNPPRLIEPTATTKPKYQRKPPPEDRSSPQDKFRKSKSGMRKRAGDAKHGQNHRVQN